MIFVNWFICHDSERENDGDEFILYVKLHVIYSMLLTVDGIIIQMIAKYLHFNFCLTPVSAGIVLILTLLQRLDVKSIIDNANELVPLQ